MHMGLENSLIKDLDNLEPLIFFMSQAWVHKHPLLSSIQAKNNLSEDLATAKGAPPYP